MPVVVEVVVFLIAIPQVPFARYRICNSKTWFVGGHSSDNL